MTDHSILFIVNPSAGGNKNGKNWEKRYELIQKSLNYQSDYIIADGIGTGITTTINAIDSGDYTMLVAVGGEGTSNEVVNGMYLCNSKLPLGFIRGGTVNDYLKEINWPREIEDQVEVINRANFRPTPLIKATGDESRISLNMGDIGLSASVGYMASVERRLKWIKSGLRYTLLTLRAISKWKNIPCVVTTDNHVIEGELSMLTGGFSSRIGDYQVIPQADPFGEKMGYTVTMDFKKLEIVKTMGTFKKGEHTPIAKKIYMGHTNKMKIEADRPMIMAVDGEPFTFNSDTIELESLPRAINILNPKI